MDYPFVAEYAKTARASCKTCKSSIQKDALRIGVMVQAPKFDGKIPMWHHFKCFFLKKQIASTDDIGHFASLRFEDQQRLKEKVGKPPECVGSKGKGKQIPGAANELFTVECAKSGRASCRVCLTPIKKGAVRISKLDCESEAALRYGPQPGWHHVDCFVCVKDNLGFDKSVEDLPGFSTLDDDAKSELKSKLNDNGAKKRQADPDRTEVIPAKKIKKELSDEDKALKAQSDLLFGIRDKLEAKLNKKELVQLLEENDQHVPVASRLPDVIADMLAFGALKRCPECRGQLRLRDRGYKCTGQVTEWTNCLFETDSPKRKKFTIPEDLAEQHSFLKSYKFVKRSRVFPKKAEASEGGPSTSNGSSSKPLHKFKIVLVGFHEDKKQELEKTILSLGGEVLGKISKDATCIIASEEKKAEYKSGMKSAKQNNITVVSESFLTAAKSGRAAYQLKEYSIKPWGVGLSDGASTSKKSSSVSLYQSGQKKKVVVKGVIEPDEDSGLSGMAEVVTGKKGPYNCVLGMVDIARGTNSYYKLQLLKSKYGGEYHVFRAWGRVGTSIGDKKIENFSTMESAVEEFERLYLEKTGNQWKFKDKFVKMPNMMYPLDIDYGQNDLDKVQKLEPGQSSKLLKPVQELICLIFDVAAMQRALMEFEIDLQKMPLGKLSKKQIMQAYGVLTELQNLLKSPADGGSKKNGSSHIKILDASNRFYTLIPHDFGLASPPLLDSEDAIKSKAAMLDSLLEIECAYKLLSIDDSDKDPIDHHYEQLKTDIEVLSRNSEEFKDIQAYLKNTHAPTHTNYNLTLEEVFKISRHGEVDRYKNKCMDIPNKKLLWHGSRVTNFAGILSQGLRIAPPEAPATGYMFGKGIYFADMVSKSANYCFTNRRSPTGLLLLCEVALGNMSERTSAHFVEKLPKNTHSTKGVGQTMPDPSMTKVKNGVEIPLGKPVSAPVSNSALLYNEYIVYDVNQVNIRYLLKVNFDFKY